MYDETRATLRTVGGGMGFSRPLFRCLGYANRSKTDFTPDSRNVA